MPPQPLPEWLERSLLWLNYPVSHHWLLAGVAGGLTFSLACCAGDRTARRWWQSPRLFSFLIILTLVLFRWPTWFVQDEFNPDESQMLAGALTLRDFPVYWRDVDGTTQGPLNAYTLMAGSLLGLPLNFFGARLVALLLEAGALLFTVATLRNLASERVARLAVLPALLFWSLTTHPDFLHYSSELVAVFLLALATWLLATGVAQRALPGSGAAIRLGLSGACLGLAPFAKLQGLPPALALAVIGLLALWPRDPRQRPAHFLIFAGGGVGGLALIVLLIASSGQAAEAWRSYVVNNLWYVQSAPVSGGAGTRFLSLVNTVADFQWFWWGGVTFAFITAIFSWRHLLVADRWVVVAAWSLILAAIGAVLGPGRTLPHYLEFLVAPLALLIGVHLHASTQSGVTASTFSRRFPWACVAGLLLCVVPQIVSRVRNPHLYIGQFARYRYQHVPSQAAYFIHTRAHPGDTLAMWGWYPQLYVDTGLAQGTREAQTERQFADGTMRSTYQTRYLHDLQMRQPAWFVDAVGPASLGYYDRTVHGHETWPALAGKIRDDYDFMAEIDGLRIFHRKPSPGAAKDP